MLSRAWLDGVALHDHGFIRTDVALRPADLGAGWESLRRTPLSFETSIPRVFAVGDVRYGSMKRIAAVVGEGASAVRSVHAALAIESAARPALELMHALATGRVSAAELGGNGTMTATRENRIALFSKLQDPATQPQFWARVADDIDWTVEATHPLAGRHHDTAGEK
jgi:hypothetical protein